jgi:uncharacterized protein (PEP-CTERM system associated)
MLAGGCALVTATACAQTYRFSPSAANKPVTGFVPTIGLEEVLTDNVALAPSGSEQGDLVTVITPGLRVNEKGARASLTGELDLPILLYARTGGQNNTVLPQANLLGQVEALEKFLYIEGAVSVQQTYFNPFGAQPVSLATTTANRYQSDLYRASPYIKGESKGEVKYELRDDNIWTNLSSAPVDVTRAYTNKLLGKLSHDPKPVGWSAEYERTSDKFGDQRALVSELGRLRVPIQLDYQLQVSVSGGYEDNRYTFTNPHGTIYGAGAEWSPSQTMTVKGTWEHRFFGSSYDFSFDERTPLSKWSVKATRNITSYPEQLAALPTGGDVQSILNQVLLSRIPDQGERQSVINQIISGAGLPAFLSSPLSLYAEQVYLQEQQSATAGILGARNELLFTVFRSRTEPIEGAGTPLPPSLAALTNNTQRGANVVLDHALAPSVSFNVNAQYMRTSANAPFTGNTKQRSITGTLVSQLSRKLVVEAGVRYQVLSSDVSSGYREAALFAGLVYSLH